MRVGQLFSASMLSVTALACVLGGEVLVSHYRAYASRTEAIKSVDKAGQQADAAFAKAKAAVETLSDSQAIFDGLSAAKAKLTDVRAMVDRAARPDRGRSRTDRVEHRSTRRSSVRAA
ncbi:MULTISPECIES: hypothetical protein [unclassified Bradyrhizobium]|uniref:hypothetical protein n=1 Tax=unclassified Bradyrhizobium TaxID=2631580 RepID=UPI002916332A|nr:MULTISPECIES: hypothetical protein [unclassified Bradyrhizobium]